MCVQQWKKSSWGAGGIIPRLLKATEVVFMCISGICLVSRAAGAEVLRAGGFGFLIPVGEARHPQELNST